MERPVIRNSNTIMEKVLEIILLFIVVLMVIWPICQFARLPETVPIHINIHGDIDGYGSRIVVLVLPIVGVLLYVGLTVLQRVPHLYNYPIEVTDDNAHLLYALGVQMIRFVKAIMIILFVYLTYSFICLARGVKLRYSAIIIISSCAVLAIGMVYYIVKMKKLGK